MPLTSIPEDKITHMTTTKSLAFFFMITLLAALTVSCADQDGQSAESTKTLSESDLSDSKKRISYALGVSISDQLKRDNVDLDVDAFVMAIKDVQENKDLRLTIEELQAAMLEFQQTQQQRLEDAFKVVAEANKKEGDAYMAENAKKAGVVTTASGLQYKEVVAGDGPKPTAEDTVTVHYRGTLLDGTVFDSSYDRGAPASFPLKGVIAGWTEALQLMPVGAKWELVIPADLAYGSSGAGGHIGPNATLKFEVELLEINK